MELPVRKSPRLKNYDYSLCGAYSLTICTYQHHHFFGNIDLQNNERLFNLSEIGLIVQTIMEGITQRFPEFEIVNYSIMPNHIHMLVVKSASSLQKSRSISDFVCAFKSLATREIRVNHPGMKIWKASFHDHIIRNERDFSKHWDYIDQNVNNWQKDYLFNLKDNTSPLRSAEL